MAPAGTDGTPPTALLVAAAEAASDLHRLLLRDASWTGAEKLGLGDDERGAVADLGRRLHDDLAGLEEHVTVLRGLFTDHPDWFNRTVAEAIRSDRFSDAQRADLAKLNVAGDDYAGRALRGADSLLGQVQNERDELKKKVDALRGDGPAVTDIDIAVVREIGFEVGSTLLAAGTATQNPVLTGAGGAVIAAAGALTS